MFEKCFIDLELESSLVAIIEACLQVLSEDHAEYIGVLEDLHNGDSSGFEVACIYLEDDYSRDDLCPAFNGVCFNYQNEYVVVSVETANKILVRSIEVLNLGTENQEIIKIR